MKIRVGTLRRLIHEAVNQMKLGIASANPPGEAWGVKDEPAAYEPEPGGPTYIARPEEERPEDMVDPTNLAWYTGRLGHGDTDMAGDTMDMSDRDMALTDPDLGMDEPFADTEPGAAPHRKKVG